MALQAELLLVFLLQSAHAFNTDLSLLASELINNLPGDLDLSKPNTIINDVANIFSTPLQNVVRDDLQCDGCEHIETTYEKCCACKYVPKWEGQETSLYIEYFSVLGKSLVLPQNGSDNNMVYKIEVRDSVMSDIPSNICNWDIDETKVDGNLKLAQDFEPFWSKIVKIDFTGNKIKHIVDLNCLSKLDTLNLGYNKLAHLRNDSFNKLTHLRVLNLEHNFITTVDPSVFTGASLHLTHVNLKRNKLQEIDVTNGMSLYPFCSYDFSDNTIKEFTNVHNYSLDLTNTYGPGYVSIQGNAMTNFPDLKNLLNLNSIQELGQLLDFGYDLRDVPLQCDGAIEPYLEIAQQLPTSYWREYGNISCAGPEDMVGKVVSEVKLDDLVTNYPCYQNCECEDRPSKDYVYVDCYARGITDMTKGNLPNPLYCNNIHLNISNNDIKVVANIPHLDKVSVLDISDNDVLEITDEAALMLQDLTHLELRNNENLKTIPEQFRYVDSCNIHLDGIILDCDCDSTWISEWSNKSTCGANTSIPQCRVPNHGLIPAKDFHKDMLDCDPKDTFYTRLAVVLSVVLVSLVTLAIVSYQFRYELLIIVLRLRKGNPNEVLPTFSYDVYLSFDDENTHLREWVNTELVPGLEAMGYKNFLTCRDIDIGAVRDNVTIDVLTKTRNFLVILSQSYFDEEVSCWIDLEWKHGWHMFVANKFKNIILVNYDHLSSFDVDHPKIKAFLRVGDSVNFTNQGRDIIFQISEKLGPPLANKMSLEYGLTNAKRQFDVTKMFLVDGETTEDRGGHNNLPCIIPTIDNASKAFEYEKKTLDEGDLDLFNLNIAEDDNKFNHDGGAKELAEESINNLNNDKFVGNIFDNNQLVREQPRPVTMPLKYHRLSDV